MLRIGNNIISLSILEKKFRCDLTQCLGNCCRYGDSGAPLTSEEVKILEEIQPAILPYLRDAGKSALAEKGSSVIDFEGDNVTPLVGNEECAYAIIEGNIFLCGIERAWSECQISFRKPLSCHLFPVRMKKYSEFVAVNYEEWSICSGARERGRNEGMYVYQFLKDPLIRALGEDVYNQICIAAEEFRKSI
jgi:Fe-S-cluster containining protein